jgi:hypothetical protein
MCIKPIQPENFSEIYRHTFTQTGTPGAAIIKTAKK